MDIETIYSICGAITNISYVPIFILMVASGAYRQYRAFTLFILFMALWGYADFLMGQTDEYMPLWRLYNFCNIFNGYLFYIFSNEISKKYNIKNIIIGGILCLFFLFLNYYDNILMPDAFLEMTGWELMREIIWYDLFVVYYCTMLILGTLWIYQHFQGKKTIKNLILFGCICTIIGDTYSYGTVYYESLYNFPYVAYIICFLPYSITYLVLCHRLFDARSTFLRILRWTFILSASAGSIGIIYYVLTRFYQHNITFNLDLAILAILFQIIITVLARSHTVRSWFQISDLIKLEKATKNFLSANSVYESDTELEKDILETLQAGLNIDSILLIGREKLGQYPEITKELSYAPKKSTVLSFKEAQHEKQDNHNAVPYLDEIESLGELCIPIYIEKRLAYILVLPEKKSQAPYRLNEQSIIATIRPKIALSLQILEYNKSLRDEVDRQTKQIHEQKKELEISYAKLEALDREKDVFMNMAAHELRTPMTIMRGYADILLADEQGQLNTLQKKLTENILKGSQSLIELVNDLLDLSRIDAGKMQLKYDTYPITDIVHEISENFVVLMSKKSMQYSLEESIDTSIPFETDKEKFTLICNNLLSNAYKYTPEHGKVTWKTSTIQIDGNPWLQLQVQDSGVGIPAEEVPHVFDRFANISTHNKIAATIQSTGLGLSIVKKIVTGLGGTIEVTSIIDIGSTFTVKLPYHKPA